jgi:hypothetical protein
MTLDELIAAIDDRQPTEAEQAAIYRLMSPESVIVVNGVMIGKPADELDIMLEAIERSPAKMPLPQSPDTPEK